MSFKKIFYTSILSALAFSMMFSWQSNPTKKTRQDVFNRILKTGKLTVITINNPHCYYIYRDEPMGFEYDMAKAFADYMKLQLDVVIVPWNDILSALESERGDFAASELTRTPLRDKIADFSIGYLDIQQMIIIHKNNHKIKNKEDLNGVTVYVRAGSAYIRNLVTLRNQGINIHIALSNRPDEELIRMVAEKRITATVSYSNIARLNRRYYPTISIAFSIGGKQRLRWAVKKGETRLLAKINQFIKKIKKDGTFKKIYNKYYVNIDNFDYVDLVKFHRAIDTKLPLYDHIIKKAAARYGFDWRLIAAIVYQESHFDPRATSYTGAQGIMQLTEITAAEMGIENRLDPEQSIMGGVKYLKWLYNTFKDIKDPDRTFITLAAYNVGRGHILDAQKLAKATGLDPNSWTDLKQVLPLLSYRKYYRKTAYGYCRGTEPVKYVENIRIYYDILKRKAIEHIFRQKIIV